MSWHEEKTAHSLGQLVGGQSLELPRASCREGGDARALSATSQKTLGASDTISGSILFEKLTLKSACSLKFKNWRSRSTRTSREGDFYGGCTGCPASKPSSSGRGTKAVLKNLHGAALARVRILTRLGSLPASKFTSVAPAYRKRVRELREEGATPVSDVSRGRTVRQGAVGSACRRRPFGLQGELESQSQNGNPGLPGFGNTTASGKI